MWVITTVFFIIIIPSLRHLLELLFAEISIYLFNHLGSILITVFLSGILLLLVDTFYMRYQHLCTFTFSSYRLCKYYKRKCIQIKKTIARYKLIKSTSMLFLACNLSFIPLNVSLVQATSTSTTTPTSIPLTTCEYSKAKACINNPELYPELGQVKHQDGYCLAIGNSDIPVRMRTPLPPQYSPNSPKNAYDKYGLSTKFSEWSTTNQENLKTHCPLLYNQTIVNNKHEYLCCTEGQFIELQKQISAISSSCSIMAVNLKDPWCQFACNPNQSRFVKVKQIRTVDSFHNTVQPLSRRLEITDTKTSTKMKQYESPYLIESIDLYVSSDMQRDLYDYTHLDTIPRLKCPPSSCNDGITYLNNFGLYSLNSIGSPLSINFKTMNNMTDEENAKTICPCGMKNNTQSCIKPLDTRMGSCVGVCGTKCDASDENRKYTEACYGTPVFNAIHEDGESTSATTSQWQQLREFMTKNVSKTSGRYEIAICTLFFFILLVVVAMISLRKYIKGQGLLLSNHATETPEVSNSSEVISTKECSMVDTLVSSIFKKYGSFISKRNNAIIISAIMLVIAGFLISGLRWLQTESDPIELWSAKSSTAYKNEKRFNKNFSPFYRTEQMILVPKDKGEIGRPEYLTESLRLQSDIANINHPDYTKLCADIESFVDPDAKEAYRNFTHGLISAHNPQMYLNAELPNLEKIVGSSIISKLKNVIKPNGVVLQDICWKATGGACTVQSVTQYFQNDATVLAQYQSQNLTLQHLESCLQSPVSADFSSCNAFHDASVTPISNDCSCFSNFGAPMNMYNTFLGAYPAEAEKNPKLYLKSKAIVISILVLNTEEEKHQKRVVEWERRYIEKLKNEATSNPLFDITFMSGISISDEIDRESNGNATTVAISYLLMLLYVTLCLGRSASISKGFWIHAKFSVGFFGVFTIFISVASTIGLFSWLGVKTQLIIMEVVPFLALAIGVDNIFLIVHTVEKSTQEIMLSSSDIQLSSELLVSDIISRALGNVGPSIIMASSIEAVAFLFGMISPMPAILWFALFSSVALLINVFFQFTIFLSIVTFDKHREFSERYDILCCWKPNRQRLNSDDDTTDSNDDGRRVTIADETKDIKQGYSGIAVNDELASVTWVDGIVDRYCELLGRPGIKIVVLCILVLSTISAILSINHMKHGLPQDEAMPHDSYMVEYFKSIERYLATGPPVYFVVESGYRTNPSEFDFSNPVFTSQLCDSSAQCNPTSIPSILDDLSNGGYSNVSRISPGPVYSWLDLYLQFMDPNQSPKCCLVDENMKFLPPSADNSTWNQWREDTGKQCLANGINMKDTLSSKSFLSTLEMFATANAGVDCMAGGGSIVRGQLSINKLPLDYEQIYEKGIIKQDSKDKLTAFSYRVFTEPCSTQDDWIETYRQSLRASDYISKKTGLDVWAYSMFFVFFDQYLTITFDTYFMLGLVLLTIFLLHSIYFGKIMVPLVLTLVILNVVVVVAGLMPLMGILLNGLSLVNLIIAAGVSVEFCSHLTRCFLMTPASLNGNARTKYAVKKVIQSIIFGITITKIIGLSILTFSDSRIFIKYYFYMYMSIVLVGIIHGIVILPVVLSIYADYLEAPYQKLKQHSILKKKFMQENNEIYQLQTTPAATATVA